MLKKFWNSQWLGWAAVWFSRIWNYVSIVFGILLLLWGISGAGGWIILYGLLLTILGIGTVLGVRQRKHKRLYTKCPGCQKEVKIGPTNCPSCGAVLLVREVRPYTLEEAGREDSTDLRTGRKGETLTRKKIGLLASIPALALIIGLYAYSFSPVYQVKEMVLDDFGPQTMEHIVDDNFQSPQWYSEKLDGSGRYVYAEGFCPAYGERARLKFYYDGSYVQLTEIALLDSMESYTDMLNLTTGLEILYGSTDST